MFLLEYAILFTVISSGFGRVFVVDNTSQEKKADGSLGSPFKTIQDCVNALKTNGKAGIYLKAIKCFFYGSFHAQFSMVSHLSLKSHQITIIFRSGTQGALAFISPSFIKPIFRTDKTMFLDDKF